MPTSPARRFGGLYTALIFPLIGLSGAVAPALVTQDALAQRTTTRPAPATPEPPPAAPASGAQGAGQFALADHPIMIQSLGMSIRLPLGARYETSRMTGGKAAFSMTVADNTWRMQLHNPTSSNQRLTAAAVADDLAGDLLASRVQRTKDRPGATSAARVYDRVDNLEINGQPTTRFYATIPDSLGGATVVSGYTIFQVGAGRFAILQMDCLEGAFEMVRPQYEAVVASATFRDPADLDAERKAGILAGNALLSSINRKDLEAALPTGARLYRIYKPSKTGARTDAEEVAYQRVEIKLGARGELDPAKQRRRWGQSDHDMGIVVNIAGRYIDGPRHVDSQSIFFLALDRSEEAWTIRMVVREDKKEAGWTETGVRRGDDIKVTIDQPGGNPIIKQWRRPPEAYISQAEWYLLPRLLAKRALPAVFNFYRYQSSTAELALRRDVLDPANMQDSAAPGAWILRSRPDENSPEEISLLNAEGDLLRREMPDGKIMEPIEPEALRKLWKAKGLPID